MKRKRQLGISLMALAIFGAAEGAGAEATIHEDVHIRQSVERYMAGDYHASLKSARDALAALDRKKAIAYNNICSALIRLDEFHEAVDACKQALELAPFYERAHNNLEWAYDQIVKQQPTVANYLDLSVASYHGGRLDKSIEAARKVLSLDPQNAVAYNNLCSAYARQEQWKRAIRECEKALAIDPQYQRARDNLEWARSRKAGAGN